VKPLISIFCLGLLSLSCSSSPAEVASYTVSVNALRSPSFEESVAMTYILEDNPKLDTSEISRQEHQEIQRRVKRGLSVKFQEVDSLEEADLVVFLFYYSSRIRNPYDASGMNDNVTHAFNLQAFDGAQYRKTREINSLWSTSATATPPITRADRRQVFPFLIAASMKYFGEDSIQKTKVLVPLTSSLVKWISEGTR
jgi:hypothetical protein